MAIKSMVPKTDEGLVVAENGAEVLTQPAPRYDNTGPRKYSGLAEAVQDLMGLVRGAEDAKMSVARTLAAIRDQELYRQAGLASMKDFLLTIKDQLAGLGIGSVTSAKRYLGLHDLYLVQLQLPDREVLAAVSHLNNLTPLVQQNRQTGELEDPDKPGKLGPEKFEDIARLVTRLVVGIEDKKLVEALGAEVIEQLRAENELPEELTPGKVATRVGLDAEQTAKVLAESGLSLAANTFEEIMGEPVQLPPLGWQLQHTQAIIDRVRAEIVKAEEDAEKNKPVRKVWVGYEPFDGGVYVEKIEFRRGEALIDTIEVGKQYATAVFQLLSEGDETIISGKDGEQE